MKTLNFFFVFVMIVVPVCGWCVSQDNVFSGNVNFYFADPAVDETQTFFLISVMQPILQMHWFNVFVIAVLLCIVFVLFYIKLRSIKSHYTLFEEDVAKQTEGLRAANTLLIHKNEEIYKQVGKIISHQEKILQQNFHLEYKTEALRKLNIGKDHLIATLIKDLENPVVSIHEIAESISEALPRLSKKEINAFLKTVQACSHDIQATLANVVNWNQLHNQDIGHKPSGFLIGNLVKENIVALARVLAQKQFQIDFQIDDTHGVFGDYTMIQTVFKNLLTNCIKISDGNIVIRSVASEKEVTVLIDHAADPAVAEQYTRVFKESRSVYSDMLPSGPVSALSFTIIKEFLHFNNGKINVQRDGDVRISYHIRLPIANVKAERLDNSLRADEEGTGNARRKRPAIVVADDSKDIHVYLTKVLAPAFKIFEAADGNTALALVRRVAPIAVISEVALPVMDGLYLCKTLKEDSGTSAIPFIFLTSEWDDQSKQAGFKVGAEAYLVKPVSKDVLLQTVLNIVGNRKKITKNILSNHASYREMQLDKTDDEFLAKVVRFIEGNLSDSDFDHRKICEHMAMSKSVLYVKFKAITGQGVQEFIKSVRLQKSLTLLQEGKLSINQVAIEVGFNSQSYFNKCFQRQFGMGPKAYSRKNKTVSTITDIY